MKGPRVAAPLRVAAGGGLYPCGCSVRPAAPLTVNPAPFSCHLTTVHLMLSYFSTLPTLPRASQPNYHIKAP